MKNIITVAVKNVMINLRCSNNREGKPQSITNKTVQVQNDLN